MVNLLHEILWIKFEEAESHSIRPDKRGSSHFGRNVASRRRGRQFSLSFLLGLMIVANAERW